MKSIFSDYAKRDGTKSISFGGAEIAEKQMAELENL